MARTSASASETASSDADRVQREWRRNQFAITAAAFVGFTGFTLVMPFLPLYIGQLGVTSMAEAAIWAGASLGITPALTALLSPIWGRVADRFGRKLMLERALFSFVVVMTLMAFVTRPWHVLALRAVQGLFAGYGGLTLAMAAESAPRHRMAMAIGLVQTAQRLGPALGPAIGGILAGLVGLRHSFLVTAAVYAMALIIAVTLYKEPTTGARTSAASPWRQGFREVLSLPNFGLLALAIFGLQYVDRSLGPILPLYVAELGTSPGRVAVVAGVLFSVSASAAALGHHLCGRLLTRHRPRFVVTAGAALAALASTGILAATGPLVLGLALAPFSLGIGVAMTAAYTAAGLVVPSGSHGTAFGLLNGAGLSALALSPLLSGLVGAAGLSVVFGVDIVLALLVAVLVARTMRDEVG